MNLILYLAVALVIAYFVRRHLASNRRLNAAMNVVLAKFAYERLGKDDRLRVEERAREILKRCGMPKTFHFNGDVDKFGFYALAMRELEMAHGVEGYPGWNLVRNPFLDILPHDRAFAVAQYMVKQCTGAEITVDHSHALFNQVAASVRKK